MAVKKKKKRKQYKWSNHWHKNSEEIINSIFKKDEPDMKYISENPELLKLHCHFIFTRYYVRRSLFQKYVVPTGKSEGISPKQFEFFKDLYPIIYERWAHLIRCCFDETYPLYKFFGAKGIYMSKDFLDSRKFAVWCLKNGLVTPLGMYDTYLQRKDKNYNFSPYNCYTITEKELHDCKLLKIVLDNLYFVKKYEEGHDKSVSYMTAYTRYYVYDINIEDTLSWKYDPSDIRDKQWCFSPQKFYKSVADENSCTMSVFLSRYHYSYLNGGFIARPYDMLKPDFSVSAEANRQGKLAYKQQWDRDNADKNANKSVYNKTVTSPISSQEQENNVYSYNKDLDVYSN